MAFHNKFFTICAILLSAIFTTACSVDSSTYDRKTFDYDLRGTWISNDMSVYSGTLIIEYNKITILGYEEGQTPLFGNDDQRPYKNFTKGVALSGYSEVEQFFIADAGVVQEGIRYTYYAENYGQLKFLRFTFGGRIETLQLDNRQSSVYSQ